MLYFLTTVFISHIPQWQAVKNLKIASCRDLKCQKITARHRWGVLNKGEMYDDHSNIKWHAEIKLIEFNVLWKRARRIQCPGAVNANNIQSFGACLHMSAVEKYDLLSSTIFGMKQGRMRGVVPAWCSDMGFSKARVQLLWMPVSCLRGPQIHAVQCCHWLNSFLFICLCTIHPLMAPVFLLRLSEKMNPTSKLHCKLKMTSMF